MALELRPSWCLTDGRVGQLVTLSPWVDEHEKPVLERDGDDWRPGERLTASRLVSLKTDAADLRRELGLRAGAVVGLAARWYCRTTGVSGTHVGGPQPVALGREALLGVDVPSTLANFVELETCIVVSWPNGAPPTGAAPSGGLVWSDGWTLSIAERTVLLEGSQLRLPVRSVSFAQHFGDHSSALWAIELDPSIELGDFIANVASVLINTDVTDRDFRSREGEVDLTLLPDSAVAGMSVELARALTAALLDELDDEESWLDLPDGTVGSMLRVQLVDSFGSLSAARADYLHDNAAYSRRLWSRFAPDSWKG